MWEHYVTRHWSAVLALMFGLLAVQQHYSKADCVKQCKNITGWGNKAMALRVAISPIAATVMGPPAATFRSTRWSDRMARRVLPTSLPLGLRS